MAGNLSPLRVISGVGQPLVAEMTITGAKTGAEPPRVSLASPEKFKKEHVEYPAFADATSISTTPGPDGQLIVRIRSSGVVKSPYLSLVFDVEAGGQNKTEIVTGLVGAGGKPTPEVSARDAKEAKPKASEESPARDIETGNRQYRVVKGDSLSGIASRLRPASASLEQMMVGLYHANPAAFGGNMNTLSAGRTLKVPTPKAVSAISKSEARREVHVQVANWQSWRGRMADYAERRSPGDRPEVSGDQGRIVANRPETSPDPDSSRDVLKLTKVDPKLVGGADKERPQALEEELIARDKTIEEANSRIRDLEKNVSDMQKLLEMKNRMLAKTQQQSEQILKDDAASQKAWGSWALIGGGISAVAALLGGFLYWRRRQQKPADATELGGDAQPQEPVMPAPDAPADSVAMSADGEAQPVAASIPPLTDPLPPLSGEDDFDLGSIDLSPTPTPAATATHDVYVEGKVEMDPDFDMFDRPVPTGEPKIPEAVVESDPFEFDLDADLNSALAEAPPVEIPPSANQDALGMLDLDILGDDDDIFNQAAAVVVAEKPKAKPEPVVPEQAPPPPPPPPPAASAPVVEEEKPDESLLDFNFQLDDIIDTPAVAPEPSKPDAGLTLGGDEEVDTPLFDEDDSNATKLDLAKVYIDMGDNEGATEILEEVLKDGSAEQKAAARAMLDTL